MTRHCWRTRWEHSKSAILLDDDARHDPRSPCVFGAQQHVCKRLSLLPKYITTDRDRVRPKVSDNMAMVYSIPTQHSRHSFLYLEVSQFTDEVTFIKLFFSDYVVVYSSSDWSRALICNGIN